MYLTAACVLRAVTLTPSGEPHLQRLRVSTARNLHIHPIMRLKHFPLSFGTVSVVKSCTKQSWPCADQSNHGSHYWHWHVRGHVQLHNILFPMTVRTSKKCTDVTCYFMHISTVSCLMFRLSV